jgi:hypothetical protein
VAACVQARYPHIEDTALIIAAELRRRFPPLTAHRYRGVYCLVEPRGRCSFGPPVGGRVTDRRWSIIEGMAGWIVNEIYDGEHLDVVSSAALAGRRETSGAI